ncbi:UNVERIFIED_CONTAM: hypothetical protein FKN15_056543 [Acipenser sinensis]
MSSEESYLAILRYLTDEREPYAPGTEGNVKRKIRKAAACYVVRDGTLYYQRRQKGREKFAELEVVLQAGRRRGLIEAAHITAGGEHLNRHQTWHLISQKYWWRGILKHVKDYIKECSRCQEKQDRGRVWPDSVLLDEFGEDSRTKEDDEGEEEEEEEISISELQTSARPRPSRTAKLVSKHELVFFVLSVTQLRVAACSAYFSELFIEKGAISSHEAVVDLSGFSKSSFLPLLEFAYTSNLCFNFCSMAEIATLARHLLMLEVLEICEFVHKQVEEKKLTVYQKGDVHTIVSSGVVPEEHEAAQAFTEEHIEPQPPQQQEVELPGSSEEGPFLVTVQDDDDAASGGIILNGETVAAGTKYQADIQTVRVAESTTLAAVIQSTESPAVTEVIQDDPPEKSQEPDAIVINIETAEGASKAVVAQRLVKRGRLMQPPKKQQGEQPESTESEHMCSECGMVFQRRYALIMHTLKHEKSRGYKCTLCNKDFQYAASLRAHLARHKRKTETAQPSSRATPEVDAEEGAAVGKSKGRTKREFVCDICGRTLPKLYSLRIHMLNHTGVRPHTCKVCGKSFAHKHSLKMHKALHDTLKQFQCTLCDKSFVTKRSLQEHMSIHTGESKYLCAACGKSFHRASGLSKHLKRHQPKPEIRGFPCTQCDKSFYEARDLQQHMNKHLGLKPFQCQVCGKCYSWKKDWYSHVKSHSVSEPYKCNVCGKEFYEKALFRRHVKKATHGKKGRVKQNLERECEHCGRKFMQLREYRRHMNNHQGVKPFECLTCGVAWADARSLKRHVRTHTGERPYVCPVCQDAYIDARTLRKHMTKFHNDYIPGKIMLEKDTLQFHNQGTQVEHAISIIAPELGEASEELVSEEIETVLVTEETIEAVEAVAATEECDAVSTLSDQSIMQVVNYVLSHQTGPGKLPEVPPEAIETVEVEVAHVPETE